MQVNNERSLDRVVRNQNDSFSFAAEMSLAGSPIDECVQKCMINDGRVSMMHLETDEIGRRRKKLGKRTNRMTGHNWQDSWSVAFN